MSHVLRKYRTLKPVLFLGRYLGTHEVLRLDDVTAAPLLESGHIALAETAVLLTPTDERWTQPMQR